MPITDGEMHSIMTEKSAEFLENRDWAQIHYFRCCGYNGYNPTRIRAGVGDKMILRHIAAEYLIDAPSNYRIDHNAKVWGMRMLFDEYYPNYEWFDIHYSELR